MKSLSDMSLDEIEKAFKAKAKKEMEKSMKERESLCNVVKRVMSLIASHGDEVRKLLATWDLAKKNGFDFEFEKKFQTDNGMGLMEITRNTGNAELFFSGEAGSSHQRVEVVFDGTNLNARYCEGCGTGYKEHQIDEIYDSCMKGKIDHATMRKLAQAFGRWPSVFDGFKKVVYGHLEEWVSE